MWLWLSLLMKKKSGRMFGLTLCWWDKHTFECSTVRYSDKTTSRCSWMICPWWTCCHLITASSSTDPKMSLIDIITKYGIKNIHTNLIERFWNKTEVLSFFQCQKFQHMFSGHLSKNITILGKYHFNFNTCFPTTCQDDWINTIFEWHMLLRY
jgi:hypothetical protein